MSRSGSAVPSLLFAGVVYAYWEHMKLGKR